MAIHFEDSTNLKRTILFHVNTVSINIASTIITRVHDISDTTTKQPPTPCAVLNLYLLIQKYRLFYHILDSHAMSSLTALNASGGGNGIGLLPPLIAESLISPPASGVNVLSSGFSKRVNWPLKSILTIPVAPLRCLAMMTSAFPR